MEVKLVNLALLEKNDDIIEECDLKIEKIQKKIKKIEINCFLSGENDDYNIYLENLYFGNHRLNELKD